MDNAHGWFYRKLPTLESASKQEVLDSLNLFRLWLVSGETIGTTEVSRLHIEAWLGVAHDLLSPPKDKPNETE